MPDPEGPTSPTLSPGATSMVMPRKISTGPALPSKTSRASLKLRIISPIPFFRRICLSPLTYGAGLRIRNLTFLAGFGLLAFAPLAVGANPLTIVALGDSLTQGYGLPREDGLVPQLEAWLRNNGADVTILNAGVSGDTTAGGLARTDWALVTETDAVIVILGGNDLLRGLPPEEARANLNAILAKTEARGLPTLLVPLAATKNFGPDYKQAFDAIYADAAKQHGARLAQPFFAAIFETTDRGTALKTLMQADGIHPNKAGVARVVETLGPEVLELLKIPKG